ncbi:hypothetical protein Q8A73_002885 [Channa argus]|nr:hypothetical protein Q8A73_002885 [Channa argus]
MHGRVVLSTVSRSVDTKDGLVPVRDIEMVCCDGNQHIVTLWREAALEKVDNNSFVKITHLRFTESQTYGVKFHSTQYTCIEETVQETEELQVTIVGIAHKEDKAIWSTKECGDLISICDMVVDLVPGVIDKEEEAPLYLGIVSGTFLLKLCGARPKLYHLVLCGARPKLYHLVLCGARPKLYHLVLCGARPKLYHLVLCGARPKLPIYWFGARPKLPIYWFGARPKLPIYWFGARPKLPINWFGARPKLYQLVLSSGSGHAPSSITWFYHLVRGTPQALSPGSIIWFGARPKLYHLALHILKESHPEYNEITIRDEPDLCDPTLHDDDDDDDDDDGVVNAAEMRWPEVIEAIKAQEGEDINFEELDWSTKCDALRSNPVTAMQGAPVFEEDDDQTVCNFVSKYITAELPDPNLQPELYKKVVERQRQV